MCIDVGHTGPLPYSNERRWWGRVAPRVRGRVGGGRHAMGRSSSSSLGSGWETCGGARSCPGRPLPGAEARADPQRRPDPRPQPHRGPIPTPNQWPGLCRKGVVVGARTRRGRTEPQPLPTPPPIIGPGLAGRGVVGIGVGFSLKHKRPCSNPRASEGLPLALATGTAAPYKARVPRGWAHGSGPCSLAQPTTSHLYIFPCFAG